MKNFVASLFLFLCALVSHGATPSFSGFYGTNGILVRTNPATGLVQIDGAAVTPTNGVPASTVTNIVGGAFIAATTNIVWVSKAGSDATGLRARLDKPFQTPLAAKNASLAGDTIVVLPGIYTNSAFGVLDRVVHLLKDQVNWYFYPGAEIRVYGDVLGLGVNQDITIFSDTNGPVRSRIMGSGRFYGNVFCDGNTDFGLFNITNAASDITIECDSIKGMSQQSFAFNLIYVRNCSNVVVRANVIEPEQIEAPIDITPGSYCNAIYWNNGNMSVSAERIGCSIGSAIWANNLLTGSQATNTSLWVSARYIVQYTNGFALSYSPIFVSATNGVQDYKVYIHTEEIAAGGWAQDVGAVTQVGGKLYLTVQKLGLTKGGSYVIGQYGGTLWANIQKLATTLNVPAIRQATSNALSLGSINAAIGEVEDTANVTTTGMELAGTNVISVDRWITARTVLNSTTSGKTYFKSGFTSLNTNWYFGPSIESSNATFTGLVGSGSIVAVNAAGLLFRTNITGGGTPAGNSGDVQFNEGGAFAGTNDFRFDRTNQVLHINGGAVFTNKIVQNGGGTGLELSGAFRFGGGNMLDRSGFLRMNMPYEGNGALWAFQFYGTNGANIALTLDKDGNGITTSNITVNGGGAGGVSLYDGAQTEYFRLESAFNAQTNNVLRGLSNATAGVLVAEGVGTGTNQMRAVPLGNAQYLTYNGTALVASNVPSGGATALSALTDVLISGPSAGQILMLFPDGLWHNASTIFNNYYQVTVISNVTINVGTNYEQSFAIATSNSFGITYNGTPLPGERLRVAVFNTNQFVSINMTNSSYNPLVSSNVLYYTIPTNSIASFTFVNRTNWNSAGTNRWELDSNLQKEQELLFGNGITAQTNAQGTAVTLSAGALTGSMTQTNFVMNQIYTNSTTQPILVRASAFLVGAAVNGNSVVDLMYSPTGGISYVMIARAALTTTITGFAVNQTNAISAVVTNLGNYYFTNTSSGAGNSAGVVDGSGQIATLSGVQGATGATGYISNTVQVVSGAGNGNTNYLITISTNSINDFYLGSSNVNIYTVAGGTVGTAIYWNLLITNLSAINWGASFPSGTNRWRWSGVYGTNAPSVLTNGTALMISGRSDGTNTVAGYTYFAPGL